MDTGDFGIIVLLAAFLLGFTKPGFFRAILLAAFAFCFMVYMKGLIESYHTETVTKQPTYETPAT